MLIGLGYKKFSGKDTVADYLVKEHGFTKDSFAGDLKEEVCRIWEKAILTWGADTSKYLNEFCSLYATAGPKDFVKWLVYEKKPPFIVSLLQNHGTELRRAEDQAYWTKKVLNRYIVNGRPNTVVSDVRYLNEIAAIGGQGGIIACIDRDVDRSAFGIHTSETDLDNFPSWDYVIENNGTKQQLFTAVEKMLDDLAWQ